MSSIQVSKPKTYLYMGVGIAQIAVGLGFAIPAGIGLLAGFASRSAQPFLMVLFLLLFICGGMLLFLGTRRLSLLSLFYKLSGIMSRSSCETLEDLAFKLNRGQSDLIKDIRAMLSSGFFKNAYLDTERKMFLLVGPKFVPPQRTRQVFDSTGMVEVRTKSVIPVYLVGAAWLVYILLFPLYRWFDFIIAAALSALVYWAAARLIPDKITFEEKPPAPEPEPVPINTGNADIDEALTTASAAMAEMTAIDRKLTNPHINKQVSEILRISGQIFDFVQKNPDKLRSIRQFMNYYLPTTIKLLRSYEDFSRQSAAGENIKESMEKIEKMMDTIVAACNSQLDDLYRDKAIDISVDIEVMQSVMQQEGLLSDDKKTEGGI